jgi:hypothetical protein
MHRPLLLLAACCCPLHSLLLLQDINPLIPELRTGATMG